MIIEGHVTHSSAQLCEYTEFFDLLCFLVSAFLSLCLLGPAHL